MRATNRYRLERQRYMNAHPLCEMCEAEERVTVATELDHVIPAINDDYDFFDVSNWQALCESCHADKTKEENRKMTVAQARRRSRFERIRQELAEGE